MAEVGIPLVPAVVSVESAPVPDLTEEIQKWETNNQELLDELPDDPDVFEIALPSVPENPAEKLAVLKQIDGMLRRAINSLFERTEKLMSVAPTFGKFNGPIALIPLKGRAGTWIDVDGVNIDDGTRIEITPQIQKLIAAAKKRKGDEWIEKQNAVVELHSHYAMTKEQHALEMQQEYPVFPLPVQPGPKWDDSILYGPAGDLIRKASQYCESHPAGMLVDLLVSVGSIIGRGPYFNIGETKHYTNEFMARVGDSAKSRKGTGRDMIDAVLKLVDPKWYSERISSGFGSGEAIISNIRDGVVESKMNPRTNKFESVIIPGVSDKRLCIREGELASVFILCGKPESRAGVVVREGWDSKPLRNVVKGKGKDGFSNSAKCEEPHLSISGDTTVNELRMTMPDGADENGFGNRFIYVYVYRVKDCPHGGPPIDWTSESIQFSEIIQAAKQVKHVSMTESARKWWNENYSRFEREGLDGLAGKMTSRAAAHIRRLAMIYALLDLNDAIYTEHFQAAKKLWDYCSESALFIFSGVTKEQLRILSWIEQRGGRATYKEAYAEMYHKHKLVSAIKADLAVLVSKKKLLLSGETYLKP